MKFIAVLFLLILTIFSKNLHIYDNDHIYDYDHDNDIPPSNDMYYDDNDEMIEKRVINVNNYDNREKFSEWGQVNEGNVNINSQFENKMEAPLLFDDDDEYETFNTKGLNVNEINRKKFSPEWPILTDGYQGNKMEAPLLFDDDDEYETFNTKGLNVNEINRKKFSPEWPILTDGYEGNINKMEAPLLFDDDENEYDELDSRGRPKGFGFVQNEQRGMMEREEVLDDELEFTGRSRGMEAHNYDNYNLGQFDEKGFQGMMHDDDYYYY